MHIRLKSNVSLPTAPNIQTLFSFFNSLDDFRAPSSHIISHDGWKVYIHRYIYMIYIQTLRRVPLPLPLPLPLPFPLSCNPPEE